MTCRDSVSGSLKRLWKMEGEQWQLSCRILSEVITAMVEVMAGVITQRHGLGNNYALVKAWRLVI